ncbi:MAG: argininosuccinate synthase [Deltaproteobacteria bacterium]|nr:argininosuccinate synthase [Deltaproteobacteria bacterium]
MMNYARSKGINIEATLEKPYSKDKNVMHLSFEGGILEDPWLEPPPETYELANTPEKAPDEPEYVEIDFVDGKPAALNGARMPLFELFVKLNEIGGRHGIGRVDMVENRLVGIKSRGVYETPGGSILHAAHRDIEAMSLDRETAHFKEIVSIKFAQLIYNGLWFTTLREAISKFLEITQKGVTGKVRLKCYKGTCLAVGRTAEHSLYSRELATFEKEEIYNQFDAEGFIKLFGLQIRAKKLLSGIE